MESIVNPQAKVVAGFPPIMPPFQGMVSEEQLLQLIAYLKSLKARRRSRALRRSRNNGIHMEAPALTYLNNGHGAASWLTRDHKRIALLYLVSITGLLRDRRPLRHAGPVRAADAGRDLLTSETYNKMFTMHGVVMVFFFLIPSIPAVLGNFLLPIMIGAKDLAFPRINLLSWHIYVLGGAFTLYAALAAAWTRAGRSIRPTARPRRTRT